MNNTHNQKPLFRRNRLQNLNAPRPIDFSKPPVRVPLHRRPPITWSTATLSQLEGLKIRRKLRPVNRMVSVMVAMLLQLIWTGTTSILPTDWDLYDNLLILEEWCKLQPHLFQAFQPEVLLALSWVMEFRLSFCHKWLGKTNKYFHEYLSAVIILSGPRMANDPLTESQARDALNAISPGLLPLETLPAFPYFRL